MLSRGVLILCIAFSSVEAWKFRQHAGEAKVVDNVDEEGRATAEAKANWHFEGNDGSWVEPIDLREEKYHSEKECHSDSPQEKLTERELLARNKILHKVRPWKIKNVEKVANGIAPTEFSTVYYLNNATETAREHFMTLQLRAKVSPETIVQRWPMPIMPPYEVIDPKQGIYNKDIEQQLKEFSDETLAEYMKEIPEPDAEYAISTWLATMRLLKEIQFSNPRENELFVILEDDVQLHPDWEEELLGHMKHLPQDWDVARFVYWGAKRCQDLVPVNGHNSAWNGQVIWYESRGWKLKPEQPSLLSFAATTPPPFTVPHNKDEVGESWYAGNHAYVIRAGSIPDILAQAKALPVMHVDGVFSSGHQEGWRRFDKFDVPWTWGIHSYALSRPLGYQVNHEEVERHDRPSLGSEF
jgi:hypothetical protein